MTALESRLADALELAAAALAIYAEYDQAMTGEGRGLYDSTYATTHALPAARLVLGEIGRTSRFSKLQADRQIGETEVQVVL